MSSSVLAKLTLPSLRTHLTGSQFARGRISGERNGATLFVWVRGCKQSSPVPYNWKLKQRSSCFGCVESEHTTDQREALWWSVWSVWTSYGGWALSISWVYTVQICAHHRSPPQQCDVNVGVYKRVSLERPRRNKGSCSQSTPQWIKLMNGAIRSKKMLWGKKGGKWITW